MKRDQFLKTSGAILAGAGMLSSFHQNIKSNQKPIIPKSLVKGDVIAITAPAGSIWNKSHIDNIQTILTEMGFKTKLGETLYLQEGYLAGDDETRAKELMDFYLDSAVKAILTMRGGWGCQRILDLIDFEVVKQYPKILIGFSDITSLVNVIYDQTGVITYHGPCGYSSWGDFTVSQVKKALISGQPYAMENPPHYQDELKTWVPGQAEGKLLGGNLTVLTALIGTRYDLNWEGAILFLEEIGEEPYRVDRMLWQFRQAGIFDKVNGIVIGSFKRCAPEESEKSFSLDQVFEQHFSALEIPIYQGAAIGHITPKFTLPIGVMARIDASRKTIQTLTRSTKV